MGFVFLPLLWVASLAFLVLRFLLMLYAGSSPRRASHFLCFAKESNQRKATLLCAPLRFATGTLRCSRQAGAAELASLRQLRLFSRLPLRSSAPPEGLLNSQRAIASLGHRRASLRSPAGKEEAAPVGEAMSKGRAAAMPQASGIRFPPPSGCAEERSGRRKSIAAV